MNKYISCYPLHSKQLNEYMMVEFCLPLAKCWDANIVIKFWIYDKRHKSMYMYLPPILVGCKSKENVVLFSHL